MTRKDEAPENELSDSLTAFLAVPRYLAAAYGQEVGLSLEDLDLLSLFVTSDPAGWPDWHRCVRLEFGELRERLSAKESFDVMRRWVQFYASLGPNETFERIARDAQYASLDESGAPATPMWPIWLQAIMTA